MYTSTMHVCTCVHVCLRAVRSIHVMIQINVTQTVTDDDTDSVVPPDSAPLDQSGE